MEHSDIIIFISVVAYVDSLIGHNNVNWLIINVFEVATTAKLVLGIASDKEG